jgi:Ca2+-binding RTX toxin-like protein
MTSPGGSEGLHVMLPVSYLAEFQANTTTAGAQTDASVTALADGRFVLAWTDLSSGTAVIRGRIFNADESPATVAASSNDFVISGAGATAAGHVQITALAVGGFAAAWQENASGNLAVVARTFDGSGTGAAQFQVSASVAEDRILGDVIQLSNGNLAFTYQDQTGSPQLLASTFTTAGVVSVAESTVSSFTAGAQSTDLVNLNGGKHAVVTATDASGGDIQLQLFNNAGTATLINGVATPYIVNTTTTGTQVDAKVAQLSDGHLAVAWTSDEPGGGTDIRARILSFDASGNVNASTDFLVHTTTAGNEVNPAIAAVKTGGFVVAWLDATNHTVNAQFVGADGSIAAATQFQANTNAVDAASAPQIETLADGRFIVSWTAASDTSGTGIHAQIWDPRTVGVTMTGSGTLDDSLVGTAFNDTIRGNGGNDTLLGGAGVDFIDGGVGADHMVGGDGNDDYVIDDLGDINTAGDTITETATGGTDIVQSSTVSVDLRRYANTENAALTGSNANLSITGTDGNNVIYADQANATNTSANVLTGRGGDDTYYVGSGDTVVEAAGGGYDKIIVAEVSIVTSIANVEEIDLTGALALSAIGNSDNNVLRGDGNTAANTLTGGAGDDFYYLGAGDKIVEDVAGGNDWIVSGADSIDLQAANYLNAENVDLTGTAALTAIGSAANNILRGDGNTAGNILKGLTGDDTYHVAVGDTIDEAAGSAGGNDTVSSSTLDIDLANYLNVENIELTGSAAGHSATGNTGNNLIRGDTNTTANVLKGLAGDDRYVVGTGDTIDEAAGPAGGNDTVLTFTLDIDLANFLNVENIDLFGSATGLDAKGNNGDNIIHGDTNTAANMLTGLGGGDTYYLGAGDSIVEVAGPAGGIDWVITSDQSVDLRLAKFLNVENVVLNGTGSGVGFNATGSAGDNVLRGDGSTKTNILTGLGGNDTYYVGGGDSIAETAAGGNDWVITADQSVDLRLAKFLNVENIVLTDNGSNTLFNAIGSNGDNVLRGDQSSKANILTGLAGNDTYYLGAGDTIKEAAGPAGGIDWVITADQSVDLRLAKFLNVENVVLNGTGSGIGFNAIGSVGDNILRGDGSTKTNILTGLGGGDTYYVGAGDSIKEIAGAAGGTDTVVSSSISLNLASYLNVENIELINRDPLLGPDLARTATGTSGDNLISADRNTAADILKGLGGNDRYVVGAGDKIIETATGGTDTVYSAKISLNLGLPDFANVENAYIVGTAAGLNATGNAGSNVLSGEGNTTANTLTGLGGNDFYIVGLNDKIIETATGGNDTAASSTISITLGLAAFANVENVQLDGNQTIGATGNVKANVLTGATNSAANILSGLAGDDTYFVGTGDKIIEAAGAAGGKDTVVSSTVSLNLGALIYSNVEQAVLQGTAKLDLTGNAGSNLLQGNDGNNVILGGMGNDTLIGNAGSDTFKFNFVAESGISNATRDVITDFKHGIDKIDLSAIDANGSGSGNGTFSFLAGNGAQFTGVAGQVHWGFNGTNTLIEADTNADGVPEFQILLVGHVSLTALDFML